MTKEAQKASAADGLRAILEERGKRYGAFEDFARVVQDLKRVVIQELVRQRKELDCDQREALDMILHKIGRVVTGDPNYADSWVDIAGYAQLVADRLQRGDE